MLNLFAALAGWLAWNVVLFSIYKDANENSFNAKSYVKENYDNWLASLVMIPVLLYIGHSQLSIDVDGQNIEWTDLYYLASGFAVEAVKVAWKKWKSKNQ